TYTVVAKAVDPEAGFTETFDAATDMPSGSNYGDGEFTGVGGVKWTYVHAQTEGEFPIDGRGVLLRRANEPSSLTGKFENGIKSFSFEYRKAYTGSAKRTYKVDIIVDGEVVESHDIPVFGEGSGADETVHEFKLENLNLTGVVEIKI